MPIPALNQHGLLPAGIHSAALPDIVEKFATDPHRQRLWNGCIECLSFLKNSDLVYPVFIDGSFTTDKQKPGDIDVVLDVTNAPQSHQARAVLLLVMQHDQMKRDFCVDFYINLPGKNDFADYFQYVGPKTAHARKLRVKDRRGILRVESWIHGLTN